VATPTFTALPPTLPLPAPTETQLAATPTQVPALPSATPFLPTLTLEQLRNLSITIKGADQIMRTISLKDGKFERGSDPADPGYIRARLGEKIAFGDLNQDGLEDAAITISENYGGSGVFVSLIAILNREGQPDALASLPVDDRPIINELAIKDGEIFMDATIHGPADAMCCPALPSTRFYRLIENSLVLSRFSTRTPSGAERIIQIDSPVNGTGISGPFVIKGSVTISPFENNLSYAIYKPGSNDPLEKAGFVISADGLGGPGTFELPLDLTRYANLGAVRIEISDFSPADGSYLASRTIFLTLK
jgi:hypothetical protein